MSNFTRIVLIFVALWGFSKHTFAQNLFGDLKLITTDADGAGSVFASDLDGDGDLDVLSASSNRVNIDFKIALYEEH